MVHFQGDDDYLALLLLAETPAQVRTPGFPWLVQAAPLLIAGVDVLLTICTNGVIYQLFRT